MTENIHDSRDETFCILPWVHLEVLPEGACKICCVAHESVLENGKPMNVAENTLEEIRRSDYMRGVRTALSSGVRIPACGYCWAQERLGATSQRQLWNANLAAVIEALDQRTKQGTEFIEPMPFEFVQISFGNKCNLACRMCNASYSSRIEDDPVHRKWAPRMDRRRGSGAGQGQTAAGGGGTVSVMGRKGWVDSAPWFDQEEFFKEMLEIGPRLSLIHVTGGEPFITPSFERTMQEYVARGYSKNITITLNTNLFYSERRIVRMMDLLSKFRGGRIGASIDGHGAVYEYIRYPAKWEIVERNVKLVKAMSEASGTLKFFLTTVVQAYNCLDLVELFHFADDLSLECSPHVLEGPLFLRPHVLTRDLRLKAAERLHAYAGDPPRNRLHPSNREHAARIASFLEGINDGRALESLRGTFLRFTRDLDQSRHQSLERSVPDLSSLMIAATHDPVGPNQHG